VITKRATRWSKLALLVAGVFVLAGTTMSPSYAANETAIYVVQGLPDKALNVAIDQEPPKAQDVETAAVSGPFEVKPGSHTVTLSQNGNTVLEKRFTIKEGSKVDLVSHLQAVSSSPPEVLLYDKYDGVKLTKDRALFVFSHVAAVPPVDVRVNDKVLLHKIANGQSSQMRMPADTYTIAIVATGKTKPVYVDPLSLTVNGANIVHLYLVGDQNQKTLRLAPQVLTIPATTGSEKPSEVNTGTGGQAFGHGSFLRVDLTR
jgi:Domain of unknown function (DUF4397)